MNWVLSLDEIRDSDGDRVGGKCLALSRLARKGIRVPLTLCIPAEVYERYLDDTGLRERLLLELNRKAFKDLRWEEIWDCSLRIRNMFLRGPDLERLFPGLGGFFDSRLPDGKPVVIRSSSLEEDSRKASFAGLHDSFVNVRGTQSLLKHVKLVWASLWSDAALLYRQELGLDAGRSAMAVIVQEFIEGEKSGVVFGQNPNRPHEGVVESVHGLNQGLVDGVVEPDRWLFDRKTKRVASHTAAERDRFVAPGREGVRTEALPPPLRNRPPLNAREFRRVVNLVLRSEKLFGAPQDMEWTIRGSALWTLQSRSITTLGSRDDTDKRQWYLSLRRSFENLQALGKRIVGEFIPAMKADAAAMEGIDPASLTDGELAQEIIYRSNTEARWVKVYWDEFIPFAHGVRLFGQVYNDVIRPEDPYEFVELLGSTGMESLRRNGLLEKMAEMIRGDRSLREKLVLGRHQDAGEGFLRALREFIEEFGDLSCPVTGVVQCDQGPDAVVRLLLEMAEHPPRNLSPAGKDVRSLQEQFLSRFEENRRSEALELLNLARVSYRMRDDDNIHLARIEARKMAAVDEAKRRIDERGPLNIDEASREAIDRALAQVSYFTGSQPEGAGQPESGAFKVLPRQLIGQPAGPGLGRGHARVISAPGDLAAFKHGEVLVCDAVDPNMTFVVPLASAIVERRGGMLIHGAIIAREYGLPCVTGVPEATKWIRTGDLITVDGYLGIVTIGTSPPPQPPSVVIGA